VRGAFLGGRGTSWGASAALVCPFHRGPAPVALPDPQGGRAAAVALVEVIGEGHDLHVVGCIKDRDFSAVRVCEPAIKFPARLVFLLVVGSV